MENKYTVQGEGWECKTVFIWIINQDKLKTNDKNIFLYDTHTHPEGETFVVIPQDLVVCLFVCFQMGQGDKIKLILCHLIQLLIQQT